MTEISNGSPQKTVLRWLREDGRTRGTKEGCAEGDCGACTVVVGSLAPDGSLRLRAQNSCLLFLPALDGKALWTVESLESASGLHPLQEAVVEGHGSQCGFCTPGFLMSLWADYEEHPEVRSPEQTACVLAGNLCRCTGYRPLVGAATAARAKPRVAIDRAPVERLLSAWALESPLALDTGTQAWTAPQTSDELAALLEKAPNSLLVAGATDLALRVTKGLEVLGPLVSTLEVAELKSITRDERWIWLGAAVSLTDAWEALTGMYPSLAEYAERFASPPVRNAGTLGGNVANGSPIGDSMPVLLALGARLRLQKGLTIRELGLEDFYQGYRQNALEPGEFIVSVGVPVPGDTVRLAAWKVSKRRSQDISAVAAAAWALVESGVMIDVRLGWGGVAATPVRTPRTEEVLKGKPLSREVLCEAQGVLAEEIHPLTDGRATESYRRAVAQNLLLRLEAWR